MITATGIRKDARNHLTNKWGQGVLITLCYFLIEFVLNILSTFTAVIPLLNLVIAIGLTVISVPISYGLIISFIKLKRDEEVHAFDFLTLGFSSFSRAWTISFNMLVKMLVPILLIILPYILFLFFGISVAIFNGMTSVIGNSSFSSSVLNIIAMLVSIICFVTILVGTVYFYIKYLSLALSFNIAYDEPNLKGKQVVEKSQSLMKGNKGNYFVLAISFIGWIFLSILPYIICAFFSQTLSTLSLIFPMIASLWLMPYIQVSFVCFYDSIIKK